MPVDSGQDFRFQFSRDAYVWLRLIEILKLKFDHDLCTRTCLSFELNPRVRCTFGNVCFNYLLFIFYCVTSFNVLWPNVVFSNKFQLSALFLPDFTPLSVV